jgi:hypothetical protein
MISEQSKAIADKSKIIYDERLRSALEAEHRDKFVAIEPESGDFFVGATYGESVMAARNAHPQRIAFVIRIGHDAAIQLGALTN